LDRLVSHGCRIARRPVSGERHSIFDAANSGNANAEHREPEILPRCFGPFQKTEFFVSAGYGYHSNDVRGVTITEEPNDPLTKLQASPFLVRTEGAGLACGRSFFPVSTARSACSC